MTTFAARVLEWASDNGRTGLPWQRDRDPYRIWVSEIMLQQTQVSTAIPYFERFIAAFPTIRALADADDDAVMAAWSGLGYYARARNLLAAARRIRDEHGGAFPQSFEAVAALPGVGPSTAGAILALAFDQRHTILDGNCKRVYARHAGIEGWPGSPAVAKRLWATAERHTPDVGVTPFTQAIMDLGATVCTRSAPACKNCPLASDCVAYRNGSIADLPTPRPRRRRPHRTAKLLVLRDGAGALLLERRPDAGIWGGLWSPPMVETDAEVRSALARFGVDLERVSRGDPLRHGFTHFTLDIEPIVSEVGEAGVADDARRWVVPDRLHEYGLPAPVRTILAAL